MRIRFNQILCGIGIVLIFLYSCKDNGGDPTNESESPVFGNQNLISLFGDIIIPSDATTFQKVSYMGRRNRRIFDRRIGERINVNAYLIKATFDDDFTAEVIVNPEFGNSDAALSEAKKYATVIGKLPKALRSNVETITINKGDEAFGGGNQNLLIHTDRGEQKINRGNLGATFIHEATHTSFDPEYGNSSGWVNAQIADDIYLNQYAQDYPNREDMAVSVIAYVAVRYRADRFSNSLLNEVKEAIPNRIAYFGNLTTQLDMSLFEEPS